MMKEGWGKYAEVAGLLLSVQLFPVIRDFRAGKEESLPLDFDGFVGILDANMAVKQADLIVVAPAVRHGFAIDAMEVGKSEDVEMPHIFFKGVGYPVEFLFVELFQGLDGGHGSKLRKSSWMAAGDRRTRAVAEADGGAIIAERRASSVVWLQSR